MSDDKSTQDDWGSTFKQFRIRTGLSQLDFLHAYSTLWMNLDPASTKYKQLEEIGVDNLTNLDNSVISKYESGNVPKRRTRHISLIWGLHELNVIQSAEEANNWLFEASQGALTPNEQQAIFGTVQADQDDVQPSVSNTTQPVGPIAQQIVADPQADEHNQHDTPLHSPAKPAAYKWMKQSPLKVIQWAFMSVGAVVLLILAAVTLFPKIPDVIGSNVSDNLVSNGDFSKELEGWKTKEYNGKLDMLVEDEALCANIVDPGSELIDANLEYSGLEKLEAQTEYALSFNVDTGISRQMGIQIPGSAYMIKKLKKGAQSIETTFFQDNDDDDARITLRLGESGTGKVCFDNIVIKKERTVTTLQPTPDVTPDPNNIVPNGDFEAGMSKWWLSASAGNELSLSVENGELCSKTFQDGSGYYAKMFGHRDIFSLYRGTSSQNQIFLLSFDVTKSTADAKIQVGLSGGGEPRQDVLIQSDPQIQRFEGIELAYGEPPAAYANLMFLMGLQAENSMICFDNIELIPVKAPG